MKVRLSARAKSDLADIYAFIAVDSAFYAKRFLGDLRGVLRQLGQFPKSGRVILKYGNPNIRERFHRNYRIAYSITEEAVEIATIHYTSKLPDN